VRLELAKAAEVFGRQGEIVIDDFSDIAAVGEVADEVIERSRSEPMDVTRSAAQPGVRQRAV
jgi:hypothetical protein